MAFGISLVRNDTEQYRGVVAEEAILPMNNAYDFSVYVKPGRVHRKLYTDPAVFELVMQRIF
jgi:hypothetical protein